MEAIGGPGIWGAVIQTSAEANMQRGVDQLASPSSYHLRQSRCLLTRS